MSAATFLDDVAERLESGWCQGSFARTADDLHVRSTSPDAVCWCLSGAFTRELWGAYEGYSDRVVPEPARALVSDQAKAVLVEEICRAGHVSPSHSGGTLVGYNDAEGRTRDQVVAMVRRAAERCRP